MGLERHKLPTKGWSLYTRGGTNGVFIQNDKGSLSQKVEIPSETIRMLVAEDIRRKKISDLEWIGKILKLA